MVARITAHTFDFSVFTSGDWLAGHDRMYAAMVEGDKQAKAAEQIVGRYLRFPACDGYALYVVSSVRGRTAKLVHVPYLDGYRDRTIEDMGLDHVPLSLVEKNIARRDGFEAFTRR